MRRDTSVKSARGSSGCLCVCFVLALFAAVSPYWLYNYSWTYTGYGWQTASSTVASGSYVLSSTSAQWQCAPFLTYCVVNSQWNYFSDFNNTLCQGEFYETFGQYGFCTKEGGEVQVPRTIQAIQGTAVSACVIFFVAFLVAAGSSIGNSKAALSAAILSLAGCAVTCASFSLAVSYDYYQKFGGNGWYLPFKYTGSYCDSPGGCIMQSSRVYLYWGPAFYSMVTTFIISFFTTLSLFAASKNIEDDDGDFGAGYNDAEYNPLGGDAYAQGTAEQFAYGGNPKAL